MVITNRFSNAFSEVYEILGYLNKEDYQKISIDLINMINKNRNKEYKYTIDFTRKLKEQEMLPETKAILFNIFRDYLATTEQKETIKRWQSEDINKIEESKNTKYKSKDIFADRKFEKNISVQEINKENLPVIIKEETIFKKVIEFIKKIFKKNS